MLILCKASQLVDLLLIIIIQEMIINLFIMVNSQVIQNSKLIKTDQLLINLNQLILQNEFLITNQPSNQLIIYVNYNQYQFFQHTQPRIYYFSMVKVNSHQIKFYHSYKTIKFWAIYTLIQEFQTQIISARLTAFDLDFVFTSSFNLKNQNVFTQTFLISQKFNYQLNCQYFVKGALLKQSTQKNVVFYLQSKQAICLQVQIKLELLVIKNKQSVFIDKIEMLINQAQLNFNAYDISQKNPQNFQRLLIISHIIIEVADQIINTYIIANYVILFLNLPTFKIKFQLIAFLDYLCLPNQFLISDRTCQQLCPNNHYIHFQIIYQKVKNICIKCNQQCKQCFLGQNQCISCHKYMNLVYNKCTVCQISNCHFCSQFGLCYSCDQGFIFVEGECSICKQKCKKCPKGFYVLQDHCIGCQKNCNQCIAYERCVICKQDYRNLQGLCKVQVRESVLNQLTLKLECQWPLINIENQCRIFNSRLNRSQIQELYNQILFSSRLVSTVIHFVLLSFSNAFLEETLNTFLLFQAIIQFTDHYKSSLQYSFLLVFLKSITSLEFFQNIQQYINSFIDSIRPLENTKFVDIIFSQKGKILMVSSFSMVFMIFLMLIKVVFQLVLNKCLYGKSIKITRTFKQILKYLNNIFFLFSFNYFKQLYFLTFNVVNQINIFFGTLLFCTMLNVKILKKKNQKIMKLPNFTRVGDLFLFFEFLGLTIFQHKKLFLLFNGITIILAIIIKFVNRNQSKKIYLKILTLSALIYLELDILVQFNSQYYVWLLISFIALFFLRGIVCCLRVVVFSIVDLVRTILNAYRMRQKKPKKLRNVMKLK